jgi:hypothetical protein
MDAPRYWTKEFQEQLVAELNRDPAFQKAAKSFSETIVLRCKDTPSGTDAIATYRFDRGHCKGEWWEEKAPSRMRGEPFDARSALARTTAPYPVWVKLDKGEMNVLQTLTHSDYVLEGSKLKVVRHVGVLNAMNAVAARVKKSY